MAGLNVSNLLGAAANLTTALSEERTLKSFLQTMNDFGLQVKNNFEVNFSGLQDATFFIQSIDIPSIHQNFTTVNYNGRVVDVPINHDYGHGFSMTVLNDAQGYIYSAITNFLATDASNTLANGGYTMTIKSLTGDKEHYSGALVTLRGVRIESVSGLQWGYEDNGYQTFTVHGKLIDYTYTPGALAKAAGIIGTVNAVLGAQ